ncbi:hypothetical protein SAMN05421850_1421, partial [Lutimaribacter saemankumensis]
ASVGKTYLACANARKLGTCSQRTGFRREVLEEAVLELLSDRLMQPEAVAAFITAFTAETNRQRGEDNRVRVRLETELRDINRKLDGLYDAIADGLRSAGLQERLGTLEEKKAELEAQLAAPPPSPVRLHPALCEHYRAKVADLAASLADPEIRTRALELIRGLIAQVTVHVAPSGGVTLEVEGALTALIEAAQPGALVDVDHGSVKLVAGARNHRCRAKLLCHI